MSFARMRALTVVGALVVCALILVTMALLRDRGHSTTVAADCPQGAVPADVKVPIPEQVKVQVFNATDKPGLATDVANDFKNRKFQVVGQGNDPLARKVDAVAVLRYGPKAVGAAWLVRTHFLNEASNEFDINRDNDIVDIVVGTRFRQLATVTEVNQAIGQVGEPTLPKGTCAAE